MPETDEDGQRADEPATTQEQNAATDSHQDDVYLHITGQGAISFNKTTGRFELYALDDKGEIVRDSKVVFSEKTEGLLFNNLHLPIEVTKAKASEVQQKLAMGSPHLRVSVETGDFSQSPFKMFMNCQPPPIGCPNLID
jgi:hypothetical protein